MKKDESVIDAYLGHDATPENRARIAAVVALLEAVHNKDHEGFKALVEAVTPLDHATLLEMFSAQVEITLSMIYGPAGAKLAHEGWLKNMRRGVNGLLAQES